MVAFFGIISIGFGISGCLWVNSRKFNRRNAVGVEEHKDYGDMLKNKSLEGLVQFFCSLLAVFGLFATSFGILSGM